MKSARKIRWEVDETAAVILDGQSKITNWLYNQLLERANQLRTDYRTARDSEVGRTLYSKRGLRNLVPRLKQQYPFLKTVYSSPLKNAALRLSRAIREYQKSRRGERPGSPIEWPRFRAWKRHWFSLEYDEPWKGYAVAGRILTLQLGVAAAGERLSVTGPLASPLPAADRERVKQLRIVKEAGHYFVVFTLEQEALPPRNFTLSGTPAKSNSEFIEKREVQEEETAQQKETSRLRVIAFDPNHKNLAYGVGTNGQAVEIENLETLRCLDERIDWLKSRRDRCQRKSHLVEYRRDDGSVHRHWQASRRWHYFNRLLEQAYRKRRDQTKTFLFTLANRLCREYDIIGIGDYAPRGGGLTTKMRRAMNNQSLIGRFKQVTAWVTVRSGKVYVEYEEDGTTRTCHMCNYVVEGGLSPEVREWVCPHCQTHHVRDENAAQNGLVRTLEKLGLPRSGHTPVEIQVRWTWQVTPSGVLALRGGGTVQSSD